MTDAALLILTIASLVPAIYWSAVIYHVNKTAKTIPTAKQAASLINTDSEQSEPNICVIIPAHNEGANIQRLLQSLLTQRHVNLSAVLCLDRCTDDTARLAHEIIAQDTRFHTLEIDHCPEDWAGKVNAIWTGATTTDAAASADILVFIDADTNLHQDCLAACAALLRSRNLDMLSLLSTLEERNWYERIVQPAAGLELVRQYPVEKANRDHDRRPFANGQFIMITNNAYKAIGGHLAVKDELLEDIELARRVHAAGLRGGLFLADNMLTCRMYDTYQAFCKGWRRIYTEAAKRRADRINKSAQRAVLLGAILPSASLLAITLGAAVWATQGGLPAAAATTTGLVAITAYTIALRLAFRAAHASWLAVFTYPFASIVVARILRRAAQDLQSGEPTVWGGRTYHRPIRHAGDA